MRYSSDYKTHEKGRSITIESFYQPELGGSIVDGFETFGYWKRGKEFIGNVNINVKLDIYASECQGLFDTWF